MERPNYQVKVSRMKQAENTAPVVLRRNSATHTFENPLPCESGLLLEYDINNGKAQNRILTKDGYVELQLLQGNDPISTLRVGPGSIVYQEKILGEYPVPNVTVLRDEELKIGKSLKYPTSPHYLTIVETKGREMLKSGELLPCTQRILPEATPQFISEFIPRYVMPTRYNELSLASDTPESRIVQLSLLGHTPDSRTVVGGFFYIPEMQAAQPVEFLGERVIDIETGNISYQDIYQKITYATYGANKDSFVLVQLAKLDGENLKIMIRFTLPPSLSVDGFYNLLRSQIDEDRIQLAVACKAKFVVKPIDTVQDSALLAPFTDMSQWL